MVVGGVPVPVSTHAERVANFALGMILMAREVKNPVTGNPIQVWQRIHIFFRYEIINMSSAFHYILNLTIIFFIPVYSKSSLQLIFFIP